MLLLGLALRQEIRAALFVLFNPLFRKTAIANFREQFFHLFAGLLRDDARARRVVTVFGGVADGIAHIAEAAAIDEVDDKFQFVKAFEVGDFGLIPSVGERLETCLDQLAHAAAKNGLLAKQIGLGFLGEGGFQHACACATDSASVRERQFLRFARSVLFDRQ